MKHKPKIAPTNTVKALIDKYKPIEVPYNVWRFIGQEAKFVRIAGDQASIAEDYGTLQELRTAIEWYAEQLGGKVKWEE